jgi:8-oxo-dGTP pyrophosphatase MutT (NUDIX family)
MSADFKRGDVKRRKDRQILQLSHLRKLRQFEKVAAVCYRLRDGRIEFLLIRTGSGHWTFPKGGVEPGLTHAQAAALEAYEEAGVHGRMEETPFTHYVLGKRARSSTRSAAKNLPIHAHLCEVLRLSRPQESGRNRTWFFAGEAKRRLREERTSEEGAEMALVVDRAVGRIQRLRRASRAGVRELQQLIPQNDALQKVQFEATQAVGVQGQMQEALFARYAHGSLGGMQPSAAIALAVSAQTYEALQLTAPRESSENQFPPAKAQPDSPEEPPDSAAYPARVAVRAVTRVPRLSNGTTTDTQEKITQIDSARGTSGTARAAVPKKKG